MSGAKQQSRFSLSSMFESFKKVLPYFSEWQDTRCRVCGRPEQEGFQFCSQICAAQFWENLRNTPSSSGRLCKMPGCNQPCYVEHGRIHDFCGRSHARDYQAMMAEFQQQRVRESRLKAVTRNSSSGGSSYAAATASNRSTFGSSHTWSGGQTLMTQQNFASGQQRYSDSGPIRFYNRDEPYYQFTNFYPAEIILDGKSWPTTEHYFQAQKFVGSPFTEVIRNLQRPREAFDISRNPSVSRWRRKDWDEVKIDVMRKALLAKFTQHKDLRDLLLGTGQRYLIEHSPYDNFWGNGGDDSGQNHLGSLLMEIRRTIIDCTKLDTNKISYVQSETNQRNTSSDCYSGGPTPMDYSNYQTSSDDRDLNQQQKSGNSSSSLARPPLHSGQPNSHEEPSVPLDVPVSHDLVDVSVPSEHKTQLIQETQKPVDGKQPIQESLGEVFNCNTVMNSPANTTPSNKNSPGSDQMFSHQDSPKQK